MTDNKDKQTADDTDERRLVCSKHPDEGPFYLEELPNDDSIVKCPECGDEWQNFIKYPVAQVHNSQTGEIYMQNVLTGERVD